MISPVEGMLEQLEALYDDLHAGDNSVPHTIDRGMRLLFAKCAHELRIAQMEMERASTEAQILENRANVLFDEASAIESDADERLKAAQSTRRVSKAEATDIIATANECSLQVLESALELADSYIGHQEITGDAIDSWISKKANQVATTMINSLESRIVEIGTVADDVTTRKNIASTKAA